MTRSLRRILVPLDGSPLAEQALPVAATLAGKAGTPVELVGVQPLMVEPIPGEAVVVGGTLEQEAARQLERYLNEKASSLRQEAGITVTCQVLHGQPAPKIAALAKARRAGLIVMTTHGRGGLARMWLGSVADQLLRLTQTPVLLLHAQDAAVPQPLTPILVALDEELEGHVLDRAIAFARLITARRFALVHVVEPPPPIYTELSVLPAALDPEIMDAAVTRTQAHLELIATRMRQEGFEVSTHVPVGAPVGREVQDLAQRMGVGLIVMGTHGRRGAKRMLLGSVADKVVRGATRPVLVVPMSPALRKAVRKEQIVKAARQKTVYAY